ncbi:MAG: hypothetical protein WA359_04830 [Acidimicrobiales bacterium]
MSRARYGWSLVLVLAAGSLVLASCGTPTPKVSVVRLSGTPALSFATPLTSVACTVNDVCVAIGSSASGSGPTSVVEFATPHGHWFNVTLPSSTSILLTSVSCTGSQCLLAGSSPGSDVLWLFDSHTHALSILTPPTGGIGASAVTCNQVVCGLIDTGANGIPRFLTSTDAGTTWSTPEPLHFAKSDVISDFTCATSSACALGLVTLSHRFSLYVTSDAGASWGYQTVPSSWTTMTSLSCNEHKCDALASTSSNSLLVHSTNFATTWSTTKLAFSASATACTELARCVVVGARNSDAWLSTMQRSASSPVKLKYVPSPLLDVACGAKVCAAIAITTLLSFPFSS